MWAVCLLGRNRGGILDVVPPTPSPERSEGFPGSQWQREAPLTCKEPRASFPLYWTNYYHASLHATEQVSRWGHTGELASHCVHFPGLRVQNIDRGAGRAQWRYLTQAWEVRTVFPKDPGERVGTEERNQTLCTCSSFPLFCCHRGNTGCLHLLCG